MLSSKLVLIISAGLVIGGLVTLALAKKPRSIANGSWGGQHIHMNVENGSATIEYDCANGTIDGPLKVDSRGRFNLLGNHVREHGGPIRMGEDQSSVRARYSGWTDGKTMKLTVTLANTKVALGTFQLTRRIRKCL
jgi:hypothetical protein